MTWKVKGNTTMVTTTKDYDSLVRRLPLVPIESDAHLRQAHAILVELSGKEKMTRGESQYFDVLSRLTGEYEKNIFSVEPITPIQAIEYLMEENDLNQAQIGVIMGCRQGRVSEILAGTRELSKEHIARLSARFKVSANLFLPALKKAS
jgi:HTH-type transcriptional regulator/antitoxin HigA